MGENALLKMGPVLERFAARQPSYRPTEEPLAFLRGIGEDPDDPEGSIARLRASDPRLAMMFEPMLGVTFTPTRISASEKINVIPSRAELKVDCRVPPGLGEQEVRDGHRGGARRRTGGGLADRVHRAGRRQPLAGRFAADGRDLRAGSPSSDPGAEVVPVVLPGFTDSRHFRLAFPECVAYGFFPQRHQSLLESAPLIHGADERIDVRDLAFATELFRDLARASLLG